MIKQAIIPLAGLGTRLLPLTSVIQKELLPLNTILLIFVFLFSVILKITSLMRSLFWEIFISELLSGINNDEFIFASK